MTHGFKAALDLLLETAVYSGKVMVSIKTYEEIYGESRNMGLRHSLQEIIGDLP